MLSFDYHSHHWRCGHAVGEMADYLRAAYERGLTHFGVSDHGPAYWLEGDHALPGTQMALSEYPAYLREAYETRSRFANRIHLSVGVEADWIDGRGGDLARLLETEPLDYALGSVHYSLGRSIFSRERWATDAAEPIYRDYYRQVADAARSQLFDILSHLTAVEAYGPPIGELADELYPPVADAVAQSGCAVEVNTSGYRKMPEGDEPFPNRTMLRLLLARRVPLTFGSDCHKPEEVAFGSERVAALLTELWVDLAAGPQPVTIRRAPLLAYRSVV